MGGFLSRPRRWRLLNGSHPTPLVKTSTSCTGQTEDLVERRKSPLQLRQMLRLRWESTGKTWVPGISSCSMRAATEQELRYSSSHFVNARELQLDVMYCE